MATFFINLKTASLLNNAIIAGNHTDPSDAMKSQEDSDCLAKIAQIDESNNSSEKPTGPRMQPEPLQGHTTVQ
jgi:hypothetical protein